MKPLETTSQNECFLQVVPVKNCGHSDIRSGMVSSQLSWHHCPGSTCLEFTLECRVISRQQEAVRTRDRRHENRIDDSQAYFSCDLLARSICFGRSRTVAVGLPARECSSHFLSGRLENQDSARTRISAEMLMQYRKVRALDFMWSLMLVQAPYTWSSNEQRT